MEKEEIIIVNEKDEIVEYKKREELKEKEIYRVSALWIKNTDGKILLAKRALTKKKDPGKWGPAVAGTNEKNETYESNIVKEAQEEIGLTNISLIKLNKNNPRDKHNYFCQEFSVILDKEVNEFKIQKSEVAEIKWFTKEELINEIKITPENFLDCIKQNPLELFNKINL